MSKPKRHFCFNCGEDLGIYAAYHGDIQNCGKAECNREERYQYEAESAEAHEKLDRDNGWEY